MADRRPTSMELRILTALINQPPKGANEGSQNYAMRCIKTMMGEMREWTDSMRDDADSAFSSAGGYIGGMEWEKIDDGVKAAYRAAIDAASPPEDDVDLNPRGKKDAGTPVYKEEDDQA